MSEERKDCIIDLEPLKLTLEIFKCKQITYYFIVYKITNLLNNKIYVGIHKQKIIDPYEFDGYMSSSKYVENSIKKYGKENFKRETLEVCKTWMEAGDREIYWIEKLKTNLQKYPDGNGMNRHIGGVINKKDNSGENHPMYGRKHTEEELEKMRGENHYFYGQHHTRRI